MTGRKAAGAVLRASGCLLAGLVILSALSVALPRMAGLEPYSVLSGSMAPEIPTGSLAYISSAAPEDLSEGDVAAFYDQLGNVVVHRVIRNRIVEGELVTKGDANPEPDMNPVGYGSVIGRVAAHVPVLGRFAVLYAGLPGRLGAFCMAALGVLLNSLGTRLSRGRDGKDGAEAGHSGI